MSSTGCTSTMWLACCKQIGRQFMADLNRIFMRNFLFVIRPSWIELGDALKILDKVERWDEFGRSRFNQYTGEIPKTFISKTKAEAM